MAIRTEGSRPIYWRGHLCEGTVPLGMDAPVLWTLCRKRDVPTAEWRPVEPLDEITCPDCVQIMLR